jgi:hypothetical protein
MTCGLLCSMGSPGAVWGARQRGRGAARGALNAHAGGSGGDRRLPGRSQAAIADDGGQLPDHDPDGEQQDDVAWGIAYLDTPAPRSGRSWTDTGTTRQERQLKHRPEGTVRPVPVPPALVRLIRKHLDQQGTTPGGHLFRSVRGGILSESTYRRVWASPTPR